MIYTMKLTVTGDTASGKLVLVTPDGKRLAITPNKKTASFAYTVIDDKPGPLVSHGSQLCRWIAQNLYGRTQIKRLAKNVDE